MTNRYRNKRIEIQLTENEKDLFEQKFKKSQSKNMSQFIRKCVLECQIFVIDMSIFRKMQHLIGKNSTNLNQIAKRVNSTGVIYKDDIDDLRKQNDEISKELLKLQNILLGKFHRREDIYGHNKDSSH